MSNVFFVMNSKGGVGKTEVALTLNRYLKELGAEVGVIDIDKSARATAVLGEDGVLTTLNPTEAVKVANKTGNIAVLRDAFDPTLEYVDTDNLIVDIGAGIPGALNQWVTEVDLVDIFEGMDAEAHIVVVSDLTSMGLSEAMAVVEEFSASMPSAKFSLVINRRTADDRSFEEFISENEVAAAAIEHWKAKVDLKIVEIPAAEGKMLETANSFGMALVDVARGLEKAFDHVREKKEIPAADTPIGKLLADAGYLDGVTKYAVLLGRLKDVKRFKLWRAAARQAVAELVPASDVEAEAEASTEAA